MAKPHGKSLVGKEAGGDSHHWYDFVASKRRILRTKCWDGGCPQSKPGTWWVIAQPVAQEKIS